MDSVSWPEEFAQTPAGKAIEKLVAALPGDRPFTITLFGSSPLQLSVDPSLLSADVDIFGEDGADEILASCAEKAGLGEGQSDFYIQVGSRVSFRTSPDWFKRTPVQRVYRGSFVHFEPVPCPHAVPFREPTGRIPHLKGGCFLPAKPWLLLPAH